MLKPGTYIAERTESWLDSYLIRMDVKETEKSYIFKLVEFESRYSAAHIESLFKNSDRIVIRKNKGGHALMIWSDEDFTFYPYQAGIPYYFKKEEEKSCK